MSLKLPKLPSFVRPKHHSPLDTLSKKAPTAHTKAQKATKTGRRCSALPQAKETIQLPCKTLDTVTTEEMSDRQVVIFSREAYESAVNKIINDYPAQPAGEPDCRQKRMFQLRRYKKIIRSKACDLLSKDDQKNMTKVDTVYHHMFNDVHARMTKA